VAHVARSQKAQQEVRLVHPVKGEVQERRLRRIEEEKVVHVVTPYKTLGKLSDILHLNNRNNQLERRARPPRNIPLNA